MTRYGVGGEAHKQDWSKEEDSVLMGNLAMIALLTAISVIYLLALEAL